MPTCPNIPTRHQFLSTTLGTTHTTKCNYTWCSTGIVYLVTSNRCHKQYVGQSLGSLHTRLNESRCETQHPTWINIPLQEQTTHNRRRTNWRHRPHRHTNRQEKCRKRPTDQGNTLDQHTIHHNTPRSQLHLNRHHNPNQMKKPTKSKHKGDSQYNTIQHNTTHTRLHLGWSVGCLVGWLLGQLVAWSIV